ncbi:hypothetical protein PPL_09912 [Heterostelium album PN500]|uniref:TLDc domain-containing protein n=1 Tax=Heterostelium pallidum (strain ATCC 26659 / Pp 5 / PN500) TaxID=670386 RepID=D3BPP5_HETP5|nr:hypothetical protein PPL_09912 [Heterostelium album PN500]EFA76607.1 hypothetical protein PPL_09912 [Heterostelium album PN500]|eukprot:XP_020428739.1 hypothetical protein PPL_09912 [Heterostelium album PN500]
MGNKESKANHESTTHHHHHHHHNQQSVLSDHNNNHNVNINDNNNVNIKENQAKQQQQQQPTSIKKPILNTESSVLNEESISYLSKYLPGDDYRGEWQLLFSSTRNGHSYNRFCTHVTDKGSTIVIIKDDGGHIFGGFADEVWKTKFPKFYGNERCFVFSINPKLEVYRPTGIDRNFQYLNEGTTTLYNGVGMGGVQYLFGWSIDETFDYGESKGSEDGETEKSSTFGNPSLSHTKDFKCVYVEVWMVKERVLTQEEIEERAYQEARKKKKAGRSVLEAEAYILLVFNSNHSSSILVKFEL